MKAERKMLVSVYPSILSFPFCSLFVSFSLATSGEVLTSAINRAFRGVFVVREPSLTNVFL